jgi:hypothetical protein
MGKMRSGKYSGEFGADIKMQIRTMGVQEQLKLK